MKVSFESDANDTILEVFETTGNLYISVGTTKDYNAGKEKVYNLTKEEARAVIAVLQIAVQ